MLAGVAAVAAVGLWPSSGQLGPGRVELRAQWSPDGRTSLGLPPLGAISASTHDAPVPVNLQVRELDMEHVRELLAGPGARPGYARAWAATSSRWWTALPAGACSPPWWWA